MRTLRVRGQVIRTHRVTVCGGTDEGSGASFDALVNGGGPGVPSALESSGLMAKT